MILTENLVISIYADNITVNKTSVLTGNSETTVCYSDSAIDVYSLISLI